MQDREKLEQENICCFLLNKVVIIVIIWYNFNYNTFADYFSVSQLLFHCYSSATNFTWLPA